MNNFQPHAVAPPALPATSIVVRPIKPIDVQPFTLSGVHAVPRSPLVFDAPHCWGEWPADGTPTTAPASALRTSWDAHLDALWAEAIAGDAPLLAAGFHRAYIDANRARDDIDPALLAEPWPGAIVPCPTSHRGMGLIRRFALPGVPMYRQLLETADVQDRIERCYDPYHAMLDGLIGRAQAHFGRSVHIVCLSMKSVGNAMNEDSGVARPDFVVSDQEGCGTDPFLLRWVAATLGALGHSVQLNHPYRGGELVRRHGQPGRGRHSLQIAINRALYMDEASCRRHSGYPRMVRHMRRFVRQMDAGLMAELVPRRCAPLRPAPPADHQDAMGFRPAFDASPGCAISRPPCCAAGSGKRAGAAHPCGWTGR